MVKVLVTDPIHKNGIEKLKNFAEVEIAINPAGEDLIEKVSGFDAMIVRSGTTVGRDLLDAADNLKLIVRAGVGLDNIDLNYADEKGVKVENTPGASSVSVSELTFGLMLSWVRRIPKADNSLKNGKWIKSQLEGTELRDKVLGIIGTGRIGTEVAKRGDIFEMKLLANDPVKDDKFRELGGKYVDLETLLKRSDYVSLHVPLNGATRHMIGKRELELMKNSAVLVNTARGAVVDEDALIEALSNGEIEAACLDVYENVPVEDGRLMELPNVILTPHLGASTNEAQRKAGVLAAKKVEDILG